MIKFLKELFRRKIEQDLVDTKSAQPTVSQDFGLTPPRQVRCQMQRPEIVVEWNVERIGYGHAARSRRPAPIILRNTGDSTAYNVVISDIHGASGHLSFGGNIPCLLPGHVTLVHGIYKCIPTSEIFDAPSYLKPPGIESYFAGELKLIDDEVWAKQDFMGVKLVVDFIDVDDSPYRTEAALQYQDITHVGCVIQIRNFS